MLVENKFSALLSLAYIEQIFFFFTSSTLRIILFSE